LKGGCWNVFFRTFLGTLLTTFLSAAVPPTGRLALISKSYFIVISIIQPFSSGIPVAPDNHLSIAITSAAIIMIMLSFFGAFIMIMLSFFGGCSSSTRQLSTVFHVIIFIVIIIYYISLTWQQN